MLTKDILDINGNDTLKHVIVGDAHYVLISLEGQGRFVWIDFQEMTTLHGYTMPGFKSVRSAVKFLCEDYGLEPEDFQAFEQYEDAVRYVLSMLRAASVLHDSKSVNHFFLSDGVA
jgi:hypothetical protein